jgi:hypothetical protein
MAKVDLNMLKDEIKNRRSGGNVTPSRLGEKVGVGLAPKDVFLNGLLESLHTGRETASSSLIKNVDNKVATKKGESNRLQISETVSQPSRIPIPTSENYDMSPERDEQLYRDMESRRKQTLAESIEGYSKLPTIGAPMQNLPNGMPQQINEAYLTENVKKIVNNYLIENFGPVVEEAIKSTILEMYAVERIKEVLHENKDLVKTIVYETIRELQAKNKNKAQ